MSVSSPRLVLCPAPIAGGAAGAVIEEACRRQRRRHLVVGAGLLVLAVAAGGYVGAVRGPGGGTGAANVVAVQHATSVNGGSCAALPANALIVITRPRLRGSHFLPGAGLHVQPLPPRGAELWIAPDRTAGSSTGTFCAPS